MTDEKKQELRQLLEEAMGSLGILLWTRGSLSKVDPLSRPKYCKNK